MKLYLQLQLQKASKLNSTVDLDETSIKKENNLSFDAKQSEDTYVKVDSPIAEEKKSNVVKNEEMVKTKNNVKSYNYEDFKPLSIDKFLQNIKDDENLDENKALAEETIVKINAKFEQLGVGAKAISYKVGPTVTRFDIQPNDGVPISSLDKYIDDISMALSGRKVHRAALRQANADESAFSADAEHSRLLRRKYAETACGKGAHSFALCQRGQGRLSDAHDRHDSGRLHRHDGGKRTDSRT